jgi:hypothetical protein
MKRGRHGTSFFPGSTDLAQGSLRGTHAWLLLPAMGRRLSCSDPKSYWPDAFGDLRATAAGCVHGLLLYCL